MPLFFHVTCSCTFHAVLLFFSFYGLRLCFYSLSLSLSNRTSLWHPNRENPFQLRNLFKVLGYPLRLFLLFDLTSSSVMRRPKRTFLRTSRLVAFIWNTGSFYRIFSTLCYPMSFELGDGNLYMRDPCVVPSCLYKSSTLIYTTSIPLCLNLLHD